MKRNITILGSTGSIGTQALDVIRSKKSEYNVVGISANTNVDLLYSQAIEFNVEYVVIMDQSKVRYLQEKLKNTKTIVLSGVEGLEFISTIDKVEMVLTSVVGMVGLKPTISAIRADKTILLANKETLVVGGELIKKELEKTEAKILPVDSEHCAVFQCIIGENKNDIRRLILTASGGPFRGKAKDDLKGVTPDMAIKHPKWRMGKKISIDSATLMNKALEVIEAHWLFDTDYENINVVIHPQSIIHSMVEYKDGSIKAQLSNTDMKHPIQFALEYPQRKDSLIGYLDFTKIRELTFEEPDYSTFECLTLGYKAGKLGGTMPTVLNSANEEAVKLFLQNKIKFLDIAEIVKEAMNHHTNDCELTLNKILEVERETREYVNLLVR